MPAAAAARREQHNPVIKHTPFHFGPVHFPPRYPHSGLLQQRQSNELEGCSRKKATARIICRGLYERNQYTVTFSKAGCQGGRGTDQ